MEQDNQLKYLLKKGIETASADFTVNLMNRIKELKPATIPYEPLVSNAIKKAFVLIFASVVLMIFLLLITIKASQFTFVNSIQLPPISGNTYYNIIVFIAAFWMVFSINALVQRNRLKAY